MAYLDESVEGYYSTVGVVKYTSKPEIFISGLEKGGVANIHHYTYQGNYVNQDISEKVYQYQFLLYNSKGEIVDSSGWLLHNSSNDTEPTSSYDIYNFPYDLQLNESFYVEYKVKTINGLIDSSEKY